MKQSRPTEEEEPTDQPDQKRLIVDRNLWLKKKETDEVWLYKILPRMNPFLAMETFRGVKRLATALSTDTTSDGTYLWIRYLDLFKSFLRPPIFRSQEENLRILSNLEEHFSEKTVDEIEEFINTVQRKGFGYQQSSRHSFMWLWLLCRLILKERAKQLTGIIESNPNTEIKLLNAMIQYKVPENTQAASPFHLVVSARGTDEFIGDMFLTFSLFHAAEMFKNFTADVQYQLYLSVGPVIDMMFYGRIIFSFYRMLGDATRVNDLITFIRNQGRRTLSDYLIADLKRLPWLPAYVLTRPIQESMRIITETYPTNPDVGPGIYTGDLVDF